MTVSEAVRDILARVIRIREALEDGDTGYAAQLAYDLELDLAAASASDEQARS